MTKTISLAAIAALSLAACMGPEALQDSFSTDPGGQQSTLLAIDTPHEDAVRYRFRILFMRTGDAPEARVDAPSDAEAPAAPWSTYLIETQPTSYLQNVPVGADEPVTSYKLWPAEGYIYAWSAIGVDEAGDDIAASETSVEYFSAHRECRFMDETDVTTLSHLDQVADPRLCPYPAGSNAHTPASDDAAVLAVAGENDRRLIAAEGFTDAPGQISLRIDYVPAASVVAAPTDWIHYHTYDVDGDGESTELSKLFFPQADGVYRITLEAIRNADGFRFSPAVEPYHFGFGLDGCLVNPREGGVTHASSDSCAELLDDAS